MTDLARSLTQRPGDGRAYRVGIVQTAPAAGVVTVVVDGGVGVFPVLAGVAAAVGDVVLVARDSRSGGWVVGRLGTPAAAPSFPVGVEPPAPGAQLRTVAVLPTSTGTWRSGATQRRVSTTDALQGFIGPTDDPLYGWASYGDQLTALGADVGQPHSASLHVQRVAGYGAAGPIDFDLNDHAGITGAGEPINNPLGPISFEVPARPGQKVTTQLPTDHVTALLTGASRGFYLWGFDNGRLAGRDRYARAFQLTITYYG